MSNKTQLQTNNTTLDALITRVDAAKDTAASLPEAGGSGGGTSGGAINVTVYNTSMNPVYYWDESGTLCTVNAYNSTAINAKNGVLFYRQETMTLCSGDYLKHNIIFGMCVMVFLSDGGTVSCQSETPPGGGN